jgi:hypothetical protein
MPTTRMHIPVVPQLQTELPFIQFNSISKSHGTMAHHGERALEHLAQQSRAIRTPPTKQRTPQPTPLRECSINVSPLYSSRLSLSTDTASGFLRLAHSQLSMLAAISQDVRQAALHRNRVSSRIEQFRTTSLYTPGLLSGLGIRKISGRRHIFDQGVHLSVHGLALVDCAHVHNQGFQLLSWQPAKMIPGQALPVVFAAANRLAGALQL